MLFEFDLRTDNENFHNITDMVKSALKESKVQNGLCTVFSPHTTAGITINEAADPDVVGDMLFAFDKFCLVHGKVYTLLNLMVQDTEDFM